MTSGATELMRAARAIPWVSSAFKSSSAEPTILPRRSRSFRPPIMTRRALSFIWSYGPTWMWASKTGKAEDTRGIIDDRGLHANSLPAAGLPGLRGIRPADPARRLHSFHPPVGAGRPRRAAGVLPSAFAGVEAAPLLLERRPGRCFAGAALRLVPSPVAVDVDREPHRRRRLPDHRDRFLRGGRECNRRGRLRGRRRVSGQRPGGPPLEHQPVLDAGQGPEAYEAVPGRQERQPLEEEAPQAFALKLVVDREGDLEFQGKGLG